MKTPLLLVTLHANPQQEKVRTKKRGKEIKAKTERVGGIKIEAGIFLHDGKEREKTRAGEVYSSVPSVMNVALPESIIRETRVPRSFSLTSIHS